jgi:3-hydroxyisobutyrate dehydrogenase-like beta-hydroxyacid dehydrogenase
MSTRSRHIIAVLYPGELGARVAEALRGRADVITTLQGRSKASQRRCDESGIAVRAMLEDVVREADVVLSLVPPAAAEQAANEYVALARLAPANATYVDMNSIAPETASRLAQQVEQAGVAFVDGAVNGLARNLTTSGTLFLSGPRAAHVAGLFDGVMRVRVVGLEPGAASAMKMLLAGLSKGVCALFAELALAAESRGMLEPMLAASSEIYPEITQLAERMLPTYAQHATRRAGEMRELERTVENADIEPIVSSAIRKLHEELSEVGWNDVASTSATSFIRFLSQQGFLTAALAASAESSAVKE